MFGKMKKFAGLTVALGIAGMGSAMAAPLLTVPVAEGSIEACVAEIGRHANYADATSVRHDVEVEPRRSIGHKLRIATTILDESGGEAIRAYSTVCTVTPEAVPSKFRIREVRR